MSLLEPALRRLAGLMAGEGGVWCCIGSGEGQVLHLAKAFILVLGGRRRSLFIYLFLKTKQFSQLLMPTKAT